jgi:hypothetical protein
MRPGLGVSDGGERALWGLESTKKIDDSLPKRLASGIVFQKSCDKPARAFHGGA